MDPMVLRPHHILDILAASGEGKPFLPERTGSAVPEVAAAILGDLHMPLRLVACADDICKPCSLLVDGKCTNVLRQLDPPPSMQEYNDDLDRRLFRFFGWPEEAETTMGGFCQAVAGSLDGVAQICAHPGEDGTAKRANLEKGLAKLGIEPL